MFDKGGLGAEKREWQSERGETSQDMDASCLSWIIEARCGEYNESESGICSARCTFGGILFKKRPQRLQATTFEVT
jgi:hypothetical protein